jgi:hypothetical protein
LRSKTPKNQKSVGFLVRHPAGLKQRINFLPSQGTGWGQTESRWLFYFLDWFCMVRYYWPGIQKTDIFNRNLAVQ